MAREWKGAGLYWKAGSIRDCIAVGGGGGGGGGQQKQEGEAEE